MSRLRIVAVAGTLGLLLLAIALSPAGAPGEGSVLSLRPRGWHAARRYLEARGIEVMLLDVPLDAAPPAPVLVLVFPFRKDLLPSEAQALSRRAREGGLVVLAVTNDRLHRVEGAALAERDAVQAFDLPVADVRGRPPRGPGRWRAWASEEWDLQPEAETAPIRTSAPLRLAMAPDGARILSRGPQGQPVVFSFARGRGRVLVMPADVFANRRLSQAGNLELLEALAVAHPGPWAFDEFHHGLARVDAAAGGSRQALDLFLLHVALVYGLGVAAVARRFGPAWSDPPVRLGSTASFLLGLAARHRALQHHAVAAYNILRRARELEPRLGIDATTERRAHRGTPEDLMAVARSVARALRPKEKKNA